MNPLLLSAIRRSVWRLALLALLMAGSVGRAATVPPINWAALTADKAVPGQLLIGYKPGPSAQALDVVHQQVGAQVLRRYSVIPAQLVQVPDGMSLAQAASIYNASAAIDYVEPNYIVHAFRTPNDTRYAELWGMQRIRAEEAWDISIGDSNVVVAVIDTGINYNHVDLVGNMWVNPNPDPVLNDIHGARWTGGNGTITSGDPMDDHNHGTHCSGTIGGVGNNATGVVGVNWVVRLAAMKFLKAAGGGTTADAVSAIEYCVQRASQIKVLSNSWGGGPYSLTLYNVIKASMNAGQLFVAAAGNDGMNTDLSPAYPASYDLDNIVSVAAISPGFGLASFSNYGTNTVDLGAPGVDILSSVALGSPQNARYESFQGTSMACPHVAGAAALLWAISPNATWQDIKNALLDSVQTNTALVGKTLTGGDLDLMAAIANVGGLVELDRKAYRSDADVTVKVSDPGVPAVEGTVALGLSMAYPSELSNRWDSAESAYRQGVSLFFTNTFTLQSQPDELPYSAVEGDVLRVIYTNSLGFPTTASAPIDDTPPVLMDLMIEDSTDESVTVRWRTDEPADSVIWIGTNLPLTIVSATGGGAYVETLTAVNGLTGYWHRVTAGGLQEQTRYYIAALSSDWAGNEASAPTNLASVVPEDYLRFITRQRRIVWLENWEYGVQGWAVTNVGGTPCWQWGSPGYGPLAPMSGTSCWGTVLNGNYPDMANASLSSPPFAVGYRPRVTLGQWHAIEDIFDYGYIEANRGAGWELLGTVSGDSGDWQTTKFDMPPAFSGSGNVRLRFRFESDYSVEQAGWYVDDVQLSELSPDGVYITSYRVLDDPAGGDGDGFVEQGESFVLELTAFNGDLTTYSNVTAQVESPTLGVTISNGPIRTVHFGDVVSGDRTNSGYQLQMSVAAARGTRVILLVTLTADGRPPTTEQIQFVVDERESVTGLVTDAWSGLPITGATVRAEADGYPTASVLTEADGTYQLHGLYLGVDYSVYALQTGLYSRSAAVSHTPAGAPLAAHFVLGRAYASPAPAALVFSVDEGGAYSQVITLNNTNAPYADAYHYDIEIAYDTSQTNWLTVTPGVSAVEAGGVSNLTVTVDPDSLDLLQLHEARLVLTGNDVGDVPVEIPVQLTVNPAPILTYDSYRVTGGASQDGDAFVEPGETVDLEIILYNAGYGVASGVEGVLTYTGGNPAVVLNWPYLSWSLVWDRWFDPSDNTAELMVGGGVPDGEVLPFTLAVTSSLMQAWSFDFAITVSVRRAISGQVVECSDGVTPVSGAEVRVRDDDDNLVAVTNTDASGEYAVEGLDGFNYLVRVVPPTPFASPAAQTVAFAPGNGAMTADFCVADWGILASPSSLTITIPEGTESNVLLAVQNTGLTAGSVEFDVELVAGMVEPAALPAMAFPPVLWDKLDENDYFPNELLVRFAQPLGPSAMTGFLNSYGLHDLRRFDFVPAILVRTPANVALRDMAATLASEPGVRYVEPNYRLQAYRAPNDSLLTVQWAMRNTRQLGGTLGADINVMPAWDRVTGSTNVLVAIVDSGTDYNHDDLAANCVTGYDYGDNDPDPAPSYGVENIDEAMHGTHVAGTVGAVGDNGIGVVGVAWKVGLVPLKIGRTVEVPTLIGVSTVMVLSVDAAVASMQHCVSNNIPISNHSWGGSFFSGLLYESFQAAYSNGHLAIAAAGNDGRNNNDLYFRYPVGFNLPNIIGVAASNPDGEMADFSNFGSNTVEIIAPGVSIWSTIMDAAGLFSWYDAWDGTSMASPHVAGAAALLKAAAPAATWDMLRRALLDGARRDDNLLGMVGSGHLDVASSLERLAAPWLSVAPSVLNINAASTSNAVVTLNVGRHLLAGAYQATIVIRQGLNRLDVPVTLNVTPAPTPEITAARLLDAAPGGDGDGFAEPGETVEVGVVLRNAGSALFIAPSGTLSTVQAGVGVPVATGTWASMASGDSATSTAFRVTFGPAVTGPVPFQLLVKSGSRQWNLAFTIDVATRHSITGMLTDASTTNGLAAVPVEIWGDAIARVTSAVSGAYAVHGLSNGAYRLRPLPTANAGAAPQAVTIAGANGLANFALDRTAPAFTNRLGWTALKGSLSTTNWTMTNAGPDAFDFRVVEMPYRRAALISDGTQLNSVAPLLRRLGFEVAVYSNNYYYSAGYGESRGFYTGDPALLAGFDLVIADLSGPLSGGRMVSALEQAAFEDFLQRGRMLVLTEPNPITRPDDRNMQALVGADNLDRGALAGDISVSNALTSVPEFLALIAGERVQRSSAALDRAATATNAAREMLLGGGEDPKAYRYRPSIGGQVIYWAGNRDGLDWSRTGVLQDYFRTLLANEFWGDVPWLEVGLPSGSVPAGDLVTIPIAVNPAGLVEGVYRAVLAVPGDYSGQSVESVSLVVTVQMPTLRVAASVGVRDWMNQPLRGNGSATSAIFQVLYAGIDGVPDVPGMNGEPGGDDLVLALLPSGVELGRMGVGYEATPNMGRFSQESALPDGLLAGSKVFVRAWDRATFASSVAYGDSSLYTLQGLPGEMVDYLGWSVTNAPGYPGPDARDTNGDGVPDGWHIRIGTDPRLPVAPLAATSRLEAVIGSSGSASNQLNQPRRAFVAGTLLFVLDTENSRVSVWNRDGHTNLLTYGISGTVTGRFNKPAGLGLHPAMNRFAVADTQNNRIQVFDFHPTNGTITFVMAFGSAGATNGAFNKPEGVAFDLLGRIIVADTMNHRVQIFQSNGAYAGQFGSLGAAAGRFDDPSDVAVDADGLIYVADRDNHRMQIFNGAGLHLWTVGSNGTIPGRFQNPSGDAMAILGRFLVADRSNHRIQLFDANRNHLLSVGAFGVDPGQLRFPHGVAVVPQSSSFYAVDTWNSRLQLFSAVVDEDGDGLDDGWEFKHFGNLAQGAWDDPDGDGVPNVGEQGANTDPNEADSDGDGSADGVELAQGFDPNDADDKPPYVPALDAFLRAAGMVLRWQAVSGQVFKVQTRIALDGNSWEDVPGSVFTNTSDGATGYTNEPNPGDRLRFYRPVYLEY